MSSFNKVMLMGNLTRDPQLKNIGQSVVVEFGMACNRHYKTQAGEERDEVLFVDCAAFGKQAEVINQYCQKGKPIFVEGRLKYDTWEDKQGGGKRSKLSVVVENFRFLGSANSSQAGDRESGESSENPGHQEASPKSTREWRGNSKRQTETAGAGEKTRELPFDKEAKFKEADIPF